MEKLKVLNLYSGLGGNRLKWNNVEVTAVEMETKIAKAYSDQFPEDEVIIGDAHEYLRNNFEKFDFIWSSPPCQSHSKMMKATRHKLRKFPDMKLYEEIIFLKNFFKGKFVVENVVPYYKPLIEPSLKVGRHLLWSNFEIKPFELENIKGFINKSNSAAAEEMKKFLGIKYEGNIYYKKNHCPCQVLRNCVQPKAGKHIFDCAFPALINQ